METEVLLKEQLIVYGMEYEHQQVYIKQKSLSILFKQQHHTN